MPRMEPIADLNALRGILDSLRGKKLVIDITPPGRGQIISHGLYEPEELERLKTRHAGVGSEPADEPPAPVRSNAAAVSIHSPMQSPNAGRVPEELQSLRTELAELRRDLESLTDTVRRQEDAITDLRSSLGG